MDGQARDNANDAVLPGRRAFLRAVASLGTSTFLSVTARAAAQPEEVTIGPDRLDALAAEVHRTFNEGNVLRPFDAKVHGARHAVTLRRIVTYTQVPETHETVKVSGLLAIPAGVKGPLPVVSWQHGTILSFGQVPSNLLKLGEAGYAPSDAADSFETILNLHRFAGQGYAVIAADYLGKGPFREGRAEAYAVKGATVRTCADILDAGLKTLRQAGLGPSELYLNGWSQGGLNTQWLSQDLQERGVPARAAAAASPFNDLNEAFRFWTGAQGFPDPTAAAYPQLPAWVSLCLIVVLGSYRAYYGIEGLFEAAIRPQHRALAERYFKYYATDFDPAALPHPRELVVDGFFEGYTAEANSRFQRRLAANRATYWNYGSPMRLFYGLADEAIHPVMATRPLPAGGRHIDGVPVKGASHRATFLASLYGAGEETGGKPNVPDWFNILRRA